MPLPSVRSDFWLGLAAIMGGPKVTAGVVEWLRKNRHALRWDCPRCRAAVYHDQAACPRCGAALEWPG